MLCLAHIAASLPACSLLLLFTHAHRFLGRNCSVVIFPRLMSCPTQMARQQLEAAISVAEHHPGGGGGGGTAASPPELASYRLKLAQAYWTLGRGAAGLCGRGWAASGGGLLLAGAVVRGCGR